MSKKIKAVILAGGVGSRLRPYTTVLPKPLMPIDERPIIDIILNQLKRYGFKEVAISTGYLSGLIQAFCGDGKKWGLSIQYFQEENPLGTAGGLKIIDGLANDFLVINGDILTDLNFKEVFDFHKKKKAFATLAIKERVVQNDFGVIDFDKDTFELSAYREKPNYVSFVSMGINILNKKCLSCIEVDEFLGMPDLLLRMKENQLLVQCFPTKAEWLDLGRLQDFETSQDIFRKKKKKFLG